MKIIGYAICNNCVSSIVSTSESGADWGSGTPYIDEFAFACTMSVRVTNCN